jgi:phosphoglycerol transferase MdoB-like AlkP superfamily enzyme
MWETFKKKALPLKQRWKVLHRLDNKKQRRVNIATVILSPILAFYLTEFFLQMPWDIRLPIQFMNILIYGALGALLLGLTGRLERASKVLFAIAYGLGCLNYQTLFFSSHPITAGDLLSIKTAVGVSGSYKLILNANVWRATLAFIILFIGTGWAKYEIPKKKASRRALAAVSAMVFVLGGVFSTSRVAEKTLGISTARLENRENVSRNGFVLNFLHSARVFYAPEEPIYSESEIEAAIRILNESLDKFDPSYQANQSPYFVHRNQTLSGQGVPLAQEPDESSLNLTNPSLSVGRNWPMEDLRKALYNVNGSAKAALKEGEKADIVAIMNESFSDLAILGDFKTNVEILPFTSRLDTDIRLGTSHSSVVGGGTANSEFEFLTGASMGFMEDGSIPYEEYISEDLPSLARVLGEQGYETMAMHPYWDDAWSRKTIYPKLGFDRMKFQEDFIHQDKVRNFISDKALYDEILMELGRGTGKDNQFIFAVSIQNHGDYVQNPEDNFEPGVLLYEVRGQKIRDEKTGEFLESFLEDREDGLLAGFSPANKIRFIESTEEYLGLIRESDRALAYFVNQLKYRERPTLLVFFGDHQPAERVAQVFTHGGDCPVENRRKVPYFIWANYDIDEVFDQVSAMPYIAAEALPLAQAKPSTWFHFLDHVHREYPTINSAYYMNLRGQIGPVHFYDNNPMRLRQYQVLQYNYLFGGETRREELFRVEVDDGANLSRLCRDDSR